MISKLTLKPLKKCREHIFRGRAMLFKLFYITFTYNICEV